MTTQLLEPPTSEEQLLQRAAELTAGVQERLSPEADERAMTREGSAQAMNDTARELRVAQRDEFFTNVRHAVRSLASSRAWRAHELAAELLLLVEALRDAMEADPDATDPEWQQREVLQRMLVVLAAMVRQLHHDDIDRPERAAQFVAQALSDVEVGEVAVLLDTTPRMVGNYRKGEVSQIRKNPNRVTLIGQLIYELQYSMTARGMLLWFDAPMTAFGGRTARELLDEDPVANRPVLISLARGGRAQTDQGNVKNGSVVNAA